MKNQIIFNRYELKYMLTKSQLLALKNVISKYMKPDVHGKNTICSLYFDTPDYLLIRRSLEHPIYKEKLRLRSYGVAHPDSEVFMELKKKYQKVVYKRRIALLERDVSPFLLEPSNRKNSQIAREIDYAFQLYKDLAPAVLLSYEREAFYSISDSDFRITFDENILWRDYDLSLSKGIYGNAILPKDKVLMEIKTSKAIPLWLTSFLNENHIYKTSFSKYGTAYQKICQSKGEIKNYA